jgi:hypothetical protein
MAFGRTDGLFPMDCHADRTGFGTTFAARAQPLTPCDLKGAKDANKAQKRSVRAKVTAERVRDEKTEQNQSPEDPKGCPGGFLEELQHLDVGDAVVGGIEEGPDLGNVHL